jgi:hypothetical protein
MGIYHWYELGVWFECPRKPICYVRRMLPKRARLYQNLTAVPTVYFVPCIRGDDALLNGFDGQIAEEDKEPLLRLWRHIKQTDGFVPHQISCVYHAASTYSLHTPRYNIPITNLDYDRDTVPRSVLYQRD